MAAAATGNLMSGTNLPGALMVELLGSGLMMGANALIGPRGSLAATEAVAPEAPGGSGKTFIKSPAAYEAYQRYLTEESFKRQFLPPSIRAGLPDLLSPEEFFSLQYAQQDIALEGAAGRERALEALKGQSEIERTKAEKLGDIERQKVMSQYGLAQNVLESTIKSILAQPDLAGSAVLTEVARAV